MHFLSPSPVQWTRESERNGERRRQRQDDALRNCVDCAKLFKNVWFNFLSGRPSRGSLFVQFELFFRIVLTFFISDTMPACGIQRATSAAPEKILLLFLRWNSSRWKSTRRRSEEHVATFSYPGKQSRTACPRICIGRCRLAMPTSVDERNSL